MSRPPRAREPIKQAALRLFVENGVHSTGIRELARHASCSEAALYRHWRNKESLVKDLFQEHLEEVNELLRDALDGEFDLAGQSRAAVEAVYRLYDEEPLVFRFVLLVHHEMAEFIDDQMTMPQDVIQAWVERGIAAGGISGNPTVKTAALIGIFLWTAQFVIYQRLPGPLSRYLEPVARSAVQVLVG